MKQRTKLGALAGVLIILALLVIGPAMAKKYDSGKSWIGVYTQTIDEDLKEAFDLDQDRGVVVVDVADDSPADEAGLRRKDIIVEFNGQKVENGDDLADFVADLKVGEKAPVVIIRKGQKQTLEVEIGQRPQMEWFGVGNSAPQIITRNYNFSSGGDGYIGVAIHNLTEQLGEHFGVKDGEGVLITEVFEDSPAEAAGLKAGDVIISVDNENVAEVNDLQDIISEKEEGDQVSIGFLRAGQKESAAVEVAEDTFGRNRFAVPNFNFRMPNIANLKNLDHFYFSDDDNDYFDVKEYKKEMEQLKKELKEMSKELKEIKLKLD